MGAKKKYPHKKNLKNLLLLSQIGRKLNKKKIIWHFICELTKSNQLEIDVTKVRLDATLPTRPVSPLIQTAEKSRTAWGYFLSLGHTMK